MSMRKLIIAVTFIAIFAMALQVSIDTDTWWHLRTGELILEQGKIPKTDTFSYTRAGEAWRYPSSAWISEVTLFMLYDWFGPAGLNFFAAGMVVLAFTFVFGTLSGGPFLRGFTLIFAAAVSAIFWAARPYLVSFVLSGLFLWILEDYRWRRKNRLLWLPFLMVIWANSHPGFAIAFILLGIYAIDAIASRIREYVRKRGKRRKERVLRYFLGGEVLPLFLSGAAMLLAVCINPSGPALLRYPFETVSIGVLQDFIQEWQSPDFHQLGFQAFAWLLLMTFVVVGLSRREFAVSEILLLVVFGYLSLVAGRNVALFALVAPAVLTRHADPMLSDLRKRIGLRNICKATETRLHLFLNTFILMLVLVGMRAWLVLPETANRSALGPNLPVHAVEVLQRDKPAGRLFNSYNWGGYLIWVLREYPVFVDGRTDLYDDEILTQWLDIVRAEPGWQTNLDSWRINLVLGHPDWPLSKVLSGEGWTLIYEDEISVLFERPSQ
jgi:hypothetical protein